ncbi:unnamed protein product [Closterium sp. NIES-64]|nr:unnamed protein product [Closterium sp. NIES-64]
MLASCECIAAHSNVRSARQQGNLPFRTLLLTFGTHILFSLPPLPFQGWVTGRPLSFQLQASCVPLQAPRFPLALTFIFPPRYPHVSPLLAPFYPPCGGLASSHGLAHRNQRGRPALSHAVGSPHPMGGPTAIKGAGQPSPMRWARPIEYLKCIDDPNDVSPSWDVGDDVGDGCMEQREVVINIDPRDPPQGGDVSVTVDYECGGLSGLPPGDTDVDTTDNADPHTHGGASAARHADATRGMVAAEPRHRSSVDETGTNGVSTTVGAGGGRGTAEHARRWVDRRSRGGKRSGAGVAVQEEVMEDPDELIEEVTVAQSYPNPSILSIHECMHACGGVCEFGHVPANGVQAGIHREGGGRGDCGLCVQVRCGALQHHPAMLQHPYPLNTSDDPLPVVVRMDSEPPGVFAYSKVFVQPGTSYREVPALPLLSAKLVTVEQDTAGITILEVS